MGFKNRMINIFEARVMKLIQITDITKLPKWTDTDVTAVDCLLKEYRKLSSSIHLESDGVVEKHK